MPPVLTSALYFAAFLAFYLFGRYRMHNDVILDRSFLGEEKVFLLPHKQKSFNYHGHDFFELTYILDGHMEHVLDGVSYEVNSGDYFIVDYGSKHLYRSLTDSDVEYVDCLFLPEFLDRTLSGTRSFSLLLDHYLLHFDFRRLIGEPTGMTFHDDDGEVREIIQKMMREQDEKKAAYREVMRTYLMQIILITMRKISSGEAMPAQNDRICEQVMDYVAEHYAEDITLGAIADGMHYCLSYLSRAFKNGSGDTFMSYLKKYRAMQGYRLIMNTDKSIYEIASLVGYSDAKYFSGQVKKYIGRSPRELREQARRERGGYKQVRV